MEDVNTVKIITNPYIRYLLGIIRKENTQPPLFRQTMKKIGALIGYEIANDLSYENISVSTPLGRANIITSKQLANVVLINILRAATPLVEGLQEIFEEARLGIILLQRKEAASPDKITSTLYFSKLPNIKLSDVIIAADPALATGSTVIKAIENIRSQAKDNRIIIASVISTKYGIDRVTKTVERPVKIYTVEVDERLNEAGYIVPGLGDAGDRAFG